MLNLLVIIAPLKTIWMVKFWNRGNLFTTPFNWMFGKIQFFENHWCEFHFCRYEIDYTTFATAFCWYEMVWVRKTGWFSRRWLKIPECSISLAQLGESSKSKVTPLTIYVIHQTRIKSIKFNALYKLKKTWNLFWE